MSAGDREAEAQAKKGEDGSSTDDSRAATALKKYWCTGLRTVELILAIIGVGLMIGSLIAPQIVNHNINHIALIYSAYSSFIIITGILIIVRIFGETVGWRTSIAFSFIGFVMFTAAAGVIFYQWHNSYYANIRPNKEVYNLFIASGVFAVVDAAVFLVHAILTFKKDTDY